MRHNRAPMGFSIDIREQDGLRTLRFESSCVQGAMHIDQPWELVLEYTQLMMAALLLRSESDFPGKVLLIGLGAGSLTKFLYRHCPEARLTVVEIAPEVVTAARQHFGLPDDSARLEVVVGDGVEYMRTARDSYDLILVDGFNEHAHPGDLNRLPFYRDCRSRLSGQGLLVTNLIGLSQRYKGGLAYIEDVFEGRAVSFPRCRSGNTIAVATAGSPVEIALETLEQRARMLAERTGLDLLPMLEKMKADPHWPDGTLRI